MKKMQMVNGWFYKRNLSANNIVRDDGHEQTAARLGPIELVAKKPAPGLAGNAHSLDLAGDGQVDIDHSGYFPCKFGIT